MFQFPCPHCAARLRVQDRTWRGRIVPCPDCRQPVLIDEDQTGLTGLIPPREALQPRQAEPTLSSAAPAGIAGAEDPRTLLIRRLVWGTAGVLVSLLLLWAVWPFSKGERGREVTRDPEQAPPPLTENQQDPANNTVANPPEPADNTPAARLAAIGTRIQAYLDKTTTYPRETPGWSWIAQLEQQSPGAPPLLPPPGWDAPAQDPFVRRRLHNWQNPELKQIVGDDGYPASHFAGVSGVGPDAAELPADHPRAGVFGTQRITQREHIRDGLTNTLLVVGVRESLGSWAAPGFATVRSFHREPHINGPDGIGTGEPDGMFALLADGSVRFLSSQTDPVILRRMAAMADGLPLDPAVPGDPRDLPLPDQEPPAPEPVPPAPAPELPPAPTFQIERALALQLRRFEQTRPLTLQTLLQQWSELAALPVDATRVPPELLQRELQLSLGPVNLRELLSALLEPVGLTAEFGSSFGVRLQPAVAASPDP
jgi:hypothetical protein